MPIVDITPVGARTDVRPTRVTPIYLVVSEDPTSKSKVQKFVAVKLDEQVNSIKIVGFETNEDTVTINQNYQEMVNSTDKAIYKEVQLPWQRIVRIQNLIFRQK